MNREQYEAARANPKIRQEFLDGVDMKEYSPFVSSISYIHSGRVRMEIRHPLWESENIRSHIFVYNKAFKTLNWDSFYNSLVHHEGFHAKSFASNGPLEWKKILGILLSNFLIIKSRKIKLEFCLDEIAAYSNQMEHSNFYKCPLDFQELVKTRLSVYRTLAERLERK